jgi:hypothetical protein
VYGTKKSEIEQIMALLPSAKRLTKELKRMIPQTSDLGFFLGLF